MKLDNIPDIQERNTMLLRDQAALYTDAADNSRKTREKLAKSGIEDQVQRKGYRDKPLSKEETTRNKGISQYWRAMSILLLLTKETIFGLPLLLRTFAKGTKFLVLYIVCTDYVMLDDRYVKNQFQSLETVHITQ